MSIPRVSSPIYEVHVDRSRPRPTEAPTGARFREALGSAGAALLSGVESASSFVPGGSVVSAALRGDGAATVASSGSPAGTGSGEAPEAPGEPGGSTPGALGSGLVGSMADENLRLIHLQQQLQSENQRFTTLSNVMKARHETAKNAINNIR